MNIRNMLNRMERVMLNPNNLAEKVEGALYIAPIAAATHTMFSLLGAPFVQLAGFGINVFRTMSAASIGSAIVYGAARITYTDGLPQPIEVIGANIIYMGHVPLGCALVEPSSIVACTAETAASYIPVFVTSVVVTSAALFTFSLFAKSKSQMNVIPDEVELKNDANTTKLAKQH